MDKKLRLSLIFQAAGNVRGFLGGVRADTDRTGKALVETRQRVQALQRATKDVSAFRQLETRLAGTRTELGEARNEALRLGAAMDTTEKPTKQLARAFDLAKTKIQALERQQSGQVRGLGELKTKLDAAGVSTDALGAHELRLARDLKSANSELAIQSRRMDEVADRQRRMGAARNRYDKTQQLAGSMQGAGMSSVGVGVAIAAPLAAGAKSAMDLETRMTTIAQRSNMSAQATTRFEQSLLASGIAANRTRDETLTMFDELTAQGFAANDALAMGRDVGRAATAYQSEDRELAATAASLRNVGLEANQTGQAFEVMAVAGKRGSFEFKDMASAFPSLTAAAAGYGMTGLKAVSEIAAAAQIAKRGAGSSDEAATNLGNLLQKIGSPETERKFAKLGINLRDGLAAGERAGKSALETIIELSQEATGGDASKLGQIFEDAQVQKALRPLMKDLAEFRTIRDDALAANGEVDRDFAERMEDNAQAVKKMRIEAGAASIQLGKDLMPAVTGLTNAANGILSSYNNWAKANPGLAKGLALTAGGVAAVAIAGGALAIVIAAVLGPWALMRYAFVGAAPLFAPLIAGLTGTGISAGGAAIGVNALLWPVLAVVAAVALLAGGAYLIYKNWGPISGFFGNIGRRIGAAFSPIANVIGAAWALAKDVIGLGMDWITLKLLQWTPLGALVRNWGAISGYLGGVWNSAKTIVHAALGQISAAIAGFKPLNDFKAAFAGVWTWLAGLRRTMMNAGADAMRGLSLGIRGQRAAVQAQTRRVAGGMVTTTKQEHDTHSPSRVFASLGDFAMQGLGLGIRRSADNPLRRMRDAAGALTAAGAFAAVGTIVAPGMAPLQPPLGIERPVNNLQSAPRAVQVPGSLPAPIKANVERNRLERPTPENRSDPGQFPTANTPNVPALAKPSIAPAMATPRPLRLERPAEGLGSDPKSTISRLFAAADRLAASALSNAQPVRIERSADASLAIRRLIGSNPFTAAGTVAAPAMANAQPDRVERPAIQFQSGPRLQGGPAANPPSVRPGVTIGAVTIQITQLPGQNAQDLAREVARILQSPNLGSYQDNDYGEAD